MTDAHCLYFELITPPRGSYQFERGQGGNLKHTLNVEVRWADGEKSELIEHDGDELTISDLLKQERRDRTYISRVVNPINQP